VDGRTGIGRESTTLGSNSFVSTQIHILSADGQVLFDGGANFVGDYMTSGHFLDPMVQTDHWSLGAEQCLSVLVTRDLEVVVTVEATNAVAQRKLCSILSAIDDHPRSLHIHRESFGSEDVARLHNHVAEVDLLSRNEHHRLLLTGLGIGETVDSDRLHSVLRHLENGDQHEITHKDESGQNAEKS